MHDRDFLANCLSVRTTSQASITTEQNLFRYLVSIDEPLRKFSSRIENMVMGMNHTSLDLPNTKTGPEVASGAMRIMPTAGDHLGVLRSCAALLAEGFVCGAAGLPCHSELSFGAAPGFSLALKQKDPLPRGRGDDAREFPSAWLCCSDRASTCAEQLPRR